MHVSIVEPVGGHGGMDYYDYGLAYGLGENEVDVLFYTSDNTALRSYKNVETKLFFKGVWGSSFLKKTYRYLKGHFAAFLDSKKNGVKIVHLHFYYFKGINLLVLVIAKLLGLKVVVTVHDVNSFNKSSNLLIEKWCYRLIDGVIVHNRSSFNELKNKKLSLEKIAIIQHGNYLPFISSIDDKNQASPFTLLFFGQIKPEKGVDVLLKSISYVVGINRDIQLIIAGRAWRSNLDALKNSIDDLGIASFVKTDFRYIPDDEVAAFFGKADLVILPYREIYQSGVLLLAMSYGKPILCSDLEPFKEVIKDKETGFIFKTGDAEDMSTKILEIINNRELLNSVAHNASKLIRNDFDWINIGAKTLDFYKNIK